MHGVCVLFCVVCVLGFYFGFSREFGILPFLTSFRVRVSSRWGDDTNEKEESQGEERNSSQDEQKVPMPNNNNIILIYTVCHESFDTAFDSILPLAGCII
jgi:hypothetical protein